MRLTLVLWLFAALACAQQDEVAAAARSNQQTAPNHASSARVYTNDDLGYGNPADNDKAAARDQQIANLPKDKQAQARKIIQQILQQRAQITRLQDHYDKLQAIQAERANLETPPQLTPEQCVKESERCEAPRAFAMDLARTHKQLEAAAKKLEDMQDSARKQGYPPGVFDP